MNPPPKLPEGAVLLGDGGNFKIPSCGFFKGWSFDTRSPKEGWLLHDVYVQHKSMIYAAPADSEVARLNAPDPVTGERLSPDQEVMAPLKGAFDLIVPPPAGAKGELVSDPYKLDHGGEADESPSTENRRKNAEAAYKEILKEMPRDLVDFRRLIMFAVTCGQEMATSDSERELAEAKREISEKMEAIQDAANMIDDWRRRARRENDRALLMEEERNKLRADLDSARTWRPIDKAPHDLSVFVWSHLGGRETAYFCLIGDCWKNSQGETLEDQPTHWMPLPLPPTPSSEQEPVREGGQS